MSRYKYLASIIIPTYNRSELLTFSLNSLLNQKMSKNDYEVIVIDDGSEDNTREVVKAYEKKFNVRYFFQEDLGYRPGSARNIGIQNAQGRICIFIDSGVIVANDFVWNHIKPYSFSTKPITTIGYVFGFSQTNAQEQNLLRLIDCNDVQKSISNLKQNNLLDLREPYFQKYESIMEYIPAPWLFYWTCNVAASTSDLRDIGGFDSHFDGNWGGEDNDLGYRLWQNGIAININRNAVAIHYPHEKDVVVKTEQSLINVRYFHEKHQTEITKLFANTLSNTDEFVDINDIILNKMELAYI